MTTKSNYIMSFRRFGFVFVFAMEVVIKICDCKMMKMYESTSSLSDPRPISGLKLANVSDNVDVTGLPGFTICGRFNFKRLMHGQTRMFQIESVEPGKSWRMMFFLIGYERSFFSFGTKDETGSSPSWIMKEVGREDFMIWSTNRWHQICIAFQLRTNHITLIKDGVETNVDFVDPNIKLQGIPLNFLNHVYVGRCPGDGDCSRHGGQFTDVNIWKRALSKGEMLAWTSCESFAKGDLVSWESARWRLANVSQSSVNTDIICKGAELGHTLIPGKWDIDESIALCQGFGGFTSVLTSREEQEEISKIYTNNSNCVAHKDWYWAGWWDRNSEGSYEDVNTKRKLTAIDYQFWGLGEPNGDSEENCASVREGFGGFWNDVSCFQNTCAFCKIGRSPTYTMRGLCKDSKFDIHYGWTGEMLPDGEEKYTFRGFSKSILTWDPFLQVWKLETYKDPNVVAYLNETDIVPYPFGTHKWFIYNDTCSVRGRAVLRLMSFTSCNETEFSCSDGKCIPLHQRCDGITHCGDRSDEVNCERLISHSAYLKSLSPPPTPESGQIDLRLSAKIYSLLNIDEVESLVKYKMALTLSWKDSRLEFHNLNSDTTMNSLTTEEKNEIWIPTVIFDNTVDRFQGRFDEIRSIGTLSMLDDQGNKIPSKRSPFYNHLNAKIHKGEDCTITVANFFSMDFICQFDMSLYPFDTQWCRADFMLKGTDQHLVNLTTGKLEFDGPFSVLQYVIDDIRMERNIAHNLTNSVSIEIKLGRRLLSLVLTSFVPSIILVLVAFSTNFVNDQHFEAVVTVNLTTMLVIVTLFISDAKSLPPTAYMKMIDYWSIATMSMPFFEVVIHSLIDVLKMKIEAIELAIEEDRKSEMVWMNNSHQAHFAKTGLEKKDSKKNMELWIKYLRMVKTFAKYWLPALFVAFSVGFFVAGRMSLYQ